MISVKYLQVQTDTSNFCIDHLQSHIIRGELENYEIFPDTMRDMWL